MNQEEKDKDRIVQLKYYAVFSLLGLLLLKVMDVLTWKKLGVIIIVLGVLVYLIHLLNKWAAKRMEVRTEYVNYVNSKQENVKKAMDGLNELMVAQEPSLTVNPDIWYDLNESLIRYVVDYMNNTEGDPWDKSDLVVLFLTEVAPKLDKIIRSDKQEELIKEFTEQLNTNKPMYGINP
ncbi:hypothetical protein NBRC116188_10320 [Oceaniserpentilla sp. 4NH20-0058]|uniref:hypothetical protein n=1 Tax=Oceaniserpentilla sp. 4NH20-0058 TaxID=3127660 RepID=UPI0031097413